VGTILVGAPLIHFFSFSFLTQVEGFLEIMVSSSSHGSSFIRDSFNISKSISFNSSSSSDDEMIHEMFVNMDKQKQCAFAYAIVANSSNMFNANELKEGTCHSLDLGVGNVLATMQTTLGLFKILTNFILAEFDELSLLMGHTIVHHA